MANATAHNGGRGQVNFNFPSNGGEWWSNNLFKMFGRPQWTGSTMLPTDLDADGYPNINPSGKSFGWVGSLPGATTRPATTFVLTWSGNGTMAVAASGLTGASGSLTSSGGTGRYEFTLTGSNVPVTLQISSWTTKITNIKLFFKDEEANLGTSYFNTDFKNKLSAANVGMYRFHNWQEGNSSNVTKWANRKSLTYSTWGAADVRPEIYCGTTTGTNDYSINGNVGNGASVPGVIPTTGDPADRTTVSFLIGSAQTFGKITGITFGAASNNVTWTAHGLNVNDPVMFGLNGASALPASINVWECFYVKTIVDVNTITISRTRGGSAITFATAGTGSGFFATRQPTLALNGGTAFPIKWTVCQSLGASNALTASFYTMWFDSAQQAWIIGGGPGYMGYINVVPYEVMMALCLEMGAHPYFVALAPASYAGNDFITGLATYVKSVQPSWMIPVYEVTGNEIWNTTAIPTNIALAQSAAIAATTGTNWGTSISNFHPWAGMTNSINAQLLAAVYGTTLNSLSYKAASCVATVSFTGVTTSHDERMTAATYLATYGLNASNAPSNWLTHNCAATYYRCPTYYGTAQEITWAAAYAGGDSSSIPTYVADLGTASSAYLTVAGNANCYANVYTFGQRFTNKDGYKIKMIGYEGGFSPDYLNGDSANVKNYRAASKLYVKQYDYAYLNMKNFVAAGGEFPPLFQMCGPTPSSNAWSVLEDLYQTPEPPMWAAVRLFGNRKRRLRW